MTSPTVENYLKTLYRLQQRSEKDLVPLGTLASELELAPGTVTLMIKRLAELGLVDYQPRSGAKLSQRGEKTALNVLRRHRLIELFLVDVVGLDWSEVHEEAEVLEHAISDRLLERLDHMLGNPTHDPHGDPIPAASGKIARQAVRRLDQCSPGRIRIARVIDDSPAFLSLLDRQGLSPQTEVELVEHDPVADLINLRLDTGQTVQLGTSAAAKLLVTQLPPKGRSQSSDNVKAQA